MKIENFPEITRADVRGQVPEPIVRYVKPTQKQIGRLTTALQGLLTLEDNLDAEIRLLNLSNDTAETITLQRLRAKPRGVFVLRSELLDYYKLAWRVVSSNQIELKVKWDSAPTTTVATEIVVFS